ncbi:MAG: bifunctional DNA-formamidopyrimidine glycosylase/DNA-(apurinic or apyrimidinic site) lyase [Baekduia sp.]
MPELPEVETIRRALEPVVAAATIEELEISDPRWCEPAAPAELSEALTGETVASLGRRGKYLILSTGSERHLLMHLRMTGTLLVEPGPDVRYSRVRFRFSGRDVHFCDPRRFGTGMLALGDAERDRYLDARLGIEPLADGLLTGPVLRELARGRRAPVKAFLLDQRHVAGVGNIYADEALFAAGIHPRRPAGALRPVQYDRLAVTVREALERGLAAGGATIDDFRHPDGVSGSFQHDFRVHLREGEPCEACGRPIRKMVVAGRGTYVCEGCQPRPRRRGSER